MDIGGKTAGNSASVADIASSSQATTLFEFHPSLLNEVVCSGVPRFDISSSSSRQPETMLEVFVCTTVSRCMQQSDIAPKREVCGYVCLLERPQMTLSSVFFLSPTKRVAFV